MPLPVPAVGATAQYRTGMLIFFGFILLGLVAGLRIRETYCRYLSR